MVQSERCYPEATAGEESRRSHCRNSRAHNSAVECHLHTVEVVGSNPAVPTNYKLLKSKTLCVASRLCYGKRTDVDVYQPPVARRQGRHQHEGHRTPNRQPGKVVSINHVDDTTEMMVISQFGKIIRIDTKSVPATGRSTSGVKLLNLKQSDGTMGSVADRVASATVIPPEEPKTNGEN